MPKVLRPVYPAREVVACICGTTYEVVSGDGWKVIDTHQQVQPDGSKKEVPTSIEFNIPCPHCSFETQFVVTLDDMTGPDWTLTHEAIADAQAARAEAAAKGQEELIKFASDRYKDVADAKAAADAEAQKSAIVAEATPDNPEDHAFQQIAKLDKAAAPAPETPPITSQETPAENSSPPSSATETPATPAPTDPAAPAAPNS